MTRTPPPGTWYVYRIAHGEPDQVIDAVVACSAVDARIKVGVRHRLNPQCLVARKSGPTLESPALALSGGDSNH